MTKSRTRCSLRGRPTAAASFSKADFIAGLDEGQFMPFDQNTTSKTRGNLTTTFRTVAFPTLAFADDGYLYLAVSQVPPENFTPGRLGGAQARIYMTRTNGAGWAPPVQVPIANAPNADGQQFMPALAYAAGKMQMVWYDVRFDETGLTDEPLIDDEKGLGDPGIRRRRTLDLLGAQATLFENGNFSTAFPPQFTAYGVSQPDYNDVSGSVRPLRGPRVSQYLTGDPTPGSVQGSGPRQLQFNRGGLLLYGGGTIPFLGDYVDVAPIPFVRNAATGKWVFNGKDNAAQASLQTFQAAWTDNRDANVGKATTGANGQLNYSPPTTLPAGSTIADVSVGPVVQRVTTPVHATPTSTPRASRTIFR